MGVIVMMLAEDKKRSMETSRQLFPFDVMLLPANKRKG